MLKIFVEFAAYGVAAILAAVCIFVWAWKWSGWSWSVVSRQLRRSVLAVMVVLAVVATIEAQKRSGNEATGVSLPREEPPVGEAALLPLPATNTLHFSTIAVPTSGTVTLTAAWPENFLTAGQTLDILRKEDLRDETWIWLTNGVVEAGSTNMTWTIENQSPSNSFYKAVVRESLTDMDDPDGDGLPNVYELAHGMNPWLNDYAHVQKLTVGPNGEFGDIFSALAESEEYSIIAVTSGTYQVNGGVQMPPHPVMVTCEDGYAVFSGTSPTAMFLLGNGHDSGHTLFRNLYLNLTSTSGMQAGFWCGGGLPWETPGASAVFENVHIRAPNPGVEYFGWLFYAPCDAPSVIKGCCVNASGAEWIYAVFGDNPPPVVVESCTFVNFPVQSDYQSAAVGLRSTYANGAITSTPPVMVSRTLFDASFTNAWPLARFENAGDFPVTMTDCIIPSAPVSPDFMPNVTNNMHIVTSQVAWAGFPLADSPAVALGIGAFAPLANDPLADMDNDGISDYEEVFDYGTDPFLKDSDNDGILDDVEIFVDHTDPSNPYSFKQNLTVAVTNKASAAYAVYTAWGISNVGWEANGLVAFPEGFGTTNYVDASSQGATHVKAFCDLNGNGTFDADYDILRVRSIPPGSTARVDFVFGDVDDDGVSDAQERQQGTDPYDGNNFRLVATVKIESSDVVPSLTNFVAWGYSAVGWEPNDLARFAGTSLTFPVNASVIGGELFVKVFRDFNANGVYDVDVDALVSNRLTRADNGKTVTFNIGDSDGDKISDSVELAEGTNPLDKRNYCFNLSLTYTDVFQTTNALTFAASFGTNRVYGPCVVEGNVWSNDFGHCSTTTKEQISVDMWDDMNQNGEWDSGETSNKYVIVVTGHNMVETNKLAYKNFDRNNNELPDWWEAQTGLSSVTNGGAYVDTDGDGLINLYEYCYGFNPLVSDAMNTLPAVTTRTTNVMLADAGKPAVSLPKFINYLSNGQNGLFVTNAHFWARGLDTSCVSMWNSFDGKKRGGTLISARHIIFAHHFPLSPNDKVIFLGTDSTVHTNTILATQRVAGTDIRIAALQTEVDTTIIHPAKILPPDYADYIGIGQYLPVLRFDQDERFLVSEISQEIPFFASAQSESEESIMMTSPSSELWRSFYSPIRNLDSGNPFFLLAGNEIVLLGTLHWRWNGYSSCSGPFVTTYAQDIQDAMDTLAPGYSLSYLDCSPYDKLQEVPR